MSKKTFFKGTFLLTASGLLSRIMGFFYRIFLSNLIGAEGIGLYQLVVPLHQLVLAVTTSGIQTVLSRQVASHIALGEEKEARDCFCVGTILSTTLAIIASLLLFTHSDFFASEILKEKSAESLIRLISFSFPFAAVHSCANSYYLGNKKALFPSGTQILEQSIRIFSSLVLYKICLSQNIAVTASIAAAGAFFSEFAAALVSLLIITFSFHIHKYNILQITSPVSQLYTISSMAFPLTLNRILIAILAGIEVVLIPQRLRMYGLSSTGSLRLYGIFTGMALPCILFPSALTNSASVMLMPSVAELHALGYRRRIRSITQQTYSACMILGSICTAVFYFLGPISGVLLFHNTTAGLYIRTLSFICPFLYTNASLASILNGLGQTQKTLLHSILGIMIRILFVLCTIPCIGIRGYLYGLLCSEIILSFLHIYALYHLNS